MRTLRRGALAALALTAAAVAVVTAPSALAHDPDGLDAVGLAGTGTELVAFRTDDPAGAETVGSIAVQLPDTRLVGIDYRVQNGKLYGVGNAGGIYLVDDGTADAARVGQLSTVLVGTFFGVDFNPAANALRIVGDTGQNLRQPFGAGDAPAGATATDSMLNRAGTFGPASGITAAAYTNNDLVAPTQTLLYDIDTRDDRLAIQLPANSGKLTGVGPTGSLLENISGDTGLDIYTTLDGDGAATDNDAFAVWALGSEFRLLAVDLFDSRPIDRGAFPTDVLDLAVRPAQ